MVASRGERDTGAVASAWAAKIYELNVLDLAEKIQDDDDNITRFPILAREPIIAGTDRPYKIESCPQRKHPLRVVDDSFFPFGAFFHIESRPQRKCPQRGVDDSNKGSAK